MLYLPEMTDIAQDLARILEPACDRIAIAGSIRRRKHQPKDIELVAIPKFVPEGNALLWLLDTLLDQKVITIKSKCWGEKHRKFIYRDVKIDFFIADRNNWGYIYWLRTGPVPAPVTGTSSSCKSAIKNMHHGKQKVATSGPLVRKHTSLTKKRCLK